MRISIVIHILRNILSVWAQFRVSEVVELAIEETEGKRDF